MWLERAQARLWTLGSLGDLGRKCYGQIFISRTSLADKERGWGCRKDRLSNGDASGSRDLGPGGKG